MTRTKKRVKRMRTRIINVSEPTEDDEYLGRIDALMTRKALRLARKRKQVYIV